jgi:hypothetical protein
MTERRCSSPWVLDWKEVRALYARQLRERERLERVLIAMGYKLRPKVRT